MSDIYEYKTISATVPWRSIYAEPADRRVKSMVVSAEDQRQIDICLNCPYPECHDCMGAWKLLHNARPRNRKKRK